VECKLTKENIKAIGQRISFRTLFNIHSIVEIPIIQRDYAQGRPSELEVRTQFLSALSGALSKPRNDPSLPLDLDFIYGGVGDAQGATFYPLDGQQRLTTLFLLHWYLAWKEGMQDDFLNFIRLEDESRFRYSVRPSSSDFFDALLGWVTNADDLSESSVARVIEDQSWFFRSWRLDPTIQSALNMIDAIAKEFRNVTHGYSRLVDVQNPCVTFQMLDLDNFGLSDDLYIKMNARGKPLTSFETLKARLEQEIAFVCPGESKDLNKTTVSLKEYFSQKIDTSWSDLFWKYRDQKTQLFDDRLMHLIRAVALITRAPDAKDFERVAYVLRFGTGISFLKLQELGCIDRPMITTLIGLLDAWSAADGLKTFLKDKKYYDEARVFNDVINDSSRLTYEHLILFQAYCLFLIKHVGAIDANALSDWMRVVRNLVLNTPFDSLAELKRGFRGILDLLPSSGNIVDQLSAGFIRVSGFNVQQIQEERVKAYLLRRSPEWHDPVYESENHPYFKGQIEFLLKFSGVLDYWIDNKNVDWDSTDDKMYRDKYQEYVLKINMVFKDTGLRALPLYRWERALLSFGNYLLPTQSNLSFLVDQDRDASWKRLLRGASQRNDPLEAKRLLIKNVLDEISLGAEINNSLDLIIEKSTPDCDWQRLLVKHHYLIEFCKNRMIRYVSDDEIYLLKKTRRSADHAELFTYFYKVNIFQRKFDSGSALPFTDISYNVVNTDREAPCIRMTGQFHEAKVELAVVSEGDRFHFVLYGLDSGPFEQIKLRLRDELNWTIRGDGTVRTAVARVDAERTFDELATTMHADLPKT
jgi:hypothetical protein